MSTAVKFYAQTQVTTTHLVQLSSVTQSLDQSARSDGSAQQEQDSAHLVDGVPDCGGAEDQEVEAPLPLGQLRAERSAAAE